MNAKRPRMKGVIPSNHISSSFMAQKKRVANDTSISSGRRRRRAHRGGRARGRDERTECVRIAAGAARCFQVQSEQMVRVRAQCEKQNMQTLANGFEAVGLENITYT